MKLLRIAKKNIELTKGSVAAIGNFDGVHRGHQALLSSLKEHAEHLQLPMVVVLFEPQAREFFQKEFAPPRLTRLREKIKILSYFGVDYVACLRFNQSLAQMSPFEFATQIIFKNFNVKHLLVGEDFRFGRDRLGDFSLLSDIGNSRSCKVAKYPDVLLNEKRISSTAVRQALQLGEFEQVSLLLGRTYSICGRVKHGSARGREWGVPTANIQTNGVVLPLHGVFCVQVLRAGSKPLNGVANIGRRPTIDGTKQLLEVHLLDFNESLYGERLQVFFMHKLRDEIKFSSLDALIEQIHSDVLLAKKYFLQPA